ncbi:hypothetical protein TrLO_g3812 [Triparma laevis f. longispina]|uniref:Uncharacterized protein n=1 Tax=Triparma laevis f. longispina TaxID=1714387 RepID=A0A9W6ZTV4_9STRA|nr:hypothetical protein TrLO_g3812 [Triparma laevis f. longispina]
MNWVRRVVKRTGGVRIKAKAKAKDPSWDVGGGLEYVKAKREPVKRVIFLLNIMTVGDGACCYTSLFVVDIPEGVERISDNAFYACRSLTTISFSTTLTSIWDYDFAGCSSLEIVDLLHTNLQELGEAAFASCSKLMTITIPDSFQTLGIWDFHKCSKLVPSTIDINGVNKDVTPEVVELPLRALQIRRAENATLGAVRDIHRPEPIPPRVHSSLKQSLQSLLPPPTTTKRKHSSSS